MPLNPADVGLVGDPVTMSWDSRDCLLYALGVGAGVEAPHFTTENSAGIDQQVVPTMPVTMTGTAALLRRLEGVDFTKLVHAEQTVTVTGPLPVKATFRVTGRVTAMYDKGSAGIVGVASEGVYDETSAPAFTSTATLFIRGAGGWGGDRGPKLDDPVPDRSPDAVSTYSTAPNQALLYRLSGDRNPLHSDPVFAARAGFDRPILHGLCTYGFTGRALTESMLDGDVAAFGTMSARFAAPVYPGEDLTVQMWRLGDAATAFRTCKADGTLALSHGLLTHR